MAWPPLAVHGTAPALATVNNHGDPVTLSDFKGQPLVLYFYPRDDTHTGWHSPGRPVTGLHQ